MGKNKLPLYGFMLDYPVKMLKSYFIKLGSKVPVFKAALHAYT